MERRKEMIEQNSTFGAEIYVTKNKITTMNIAIKDLSNPLIRAIHANAFISSVLKKVLLL